MKNKKSILAIDPGPTESAWCRIIPTGEVIAAKVSNIDLLADVSAWGSYHDHPALAIEMIASYGMPVGAEVFDTCVWIGRMIQAWGHNHRLIYRRDVKLHLCNSPRANDASIRQALIDRFGPTKELAIGSKAKPGPLYGFKADMWAALAVAVTAADTAGGAA